MGNAIEVVLTIIGLSFWILFPISMFLSVNHIERLEELSHKSVEMQNTYYKNFQPITFDWHHPFHYFRQWLEH